MARSVGLFINSSAPLEALAHQVAGVTQAAASPGPTPGVWELRFPTVTAVLSAHQDDATVDPLLQRYPYALAADMAEGTTVADSPEVKALRDVARVLRDSTDLSALLVVDVQNRPAVAAPDGT